MSVYGSAPECFCRHEVVKKTKPGVGSMGGPPELLGPLGWRLNKWGSGGSLRTVNPEWTENIRSSNGYSVRHGRKNCEGYKESVRISRERERRGGEMEEPREQSEEGGDMPGGFQERKTGDTLPVGLAEWVRINSFLHPTGTLHRWQLTRVCLPQNQHLRGSYTG